MKFEILNVMDTRNILPIDENPNRMLRKTTNNQIRICMKRYLQSLFILMIITAFAINGNAQQLPVDPAFRIGKLDNGMTYYIRHNGEPKDRASFYIIQNVGALLENDNQNGLAHFLEHMAFNGTKNFPDKGIISTLEKHGVAFGQNINAYTAFTETVYNLSEVPVSNTGLLDTCLLVLNDWSHFLTLNDKEIDLERGVISEEWRTRRNAGFRMRAQYFPILFKDSKYAVRDIIGDLDIIKTFEPNTLKQFYHDWYRTDLQAIAIIGDINVDEMEAKIKGLFGMIPAVENPLPRKAFEVPYHKETLFASATDPEATSNSVAIYYKHDAVPADKKEIGYYREYLISSLFNAMNRDRINELLQKGQPPFVSGSVSYSNLVRDYDVFAISASANPNKESEAFKAIYTEAQRVYRYGFTPSEIERAKSNLLTMVENKYKQRDKIDNDQYASAVADHFLTREPLTSAEQDWQITQALLSTITPDDFAARVKQWIRPENRVIIVMGVEKEGVNHLTEAEALAIMKEVEQSEIKPYEDAATAASLIEGELKGSPVVKTEPMAQFDAVEWTLANNAKVVFRKADFEKDNVMLYAYSPGGSSVLDEPKLYSAMMLGQFMPSFGAGDFDAVTLKKMLAGKNVNLANQLEGMNEIFSGSSSPKDFETLLQLLYLQFEKPRFDGEAYQALNVRLKTMLQNMANNPQKIMSDSLKLILSDHHQRTKLLTAATLDKVSLEEMEKIYRDRFADAGDFTFFIVGNVDEATVKPLAEKYIGALTDLPRTEKWIDHNVSIPKGKTEREILIPLETEKATVVISMRNAKAFTPKENLLNAIVEGILRLRYTEEVREKEGGTYGVAVRCSNQHYPKELKGIDIQFDTDPAKADHLKSIIFSEIEKIATNGPTAEDFDKTVKNLQKDREQGKMHNGYWLSVLTQFYQDKIDNNAAANFEEVLNTVTANDVKEFVGSFYKTADWVDIVFKPTAK